MTAHDALARVRTILKATAGYQDFRYALFDIELTVQAQAAQPWTTALPTQPGWYAYKSPKGWLQVFEVLIMDIGLCVCIREEDMAVVEFSRAFGTGQWKGPLDLEAL